MAYFDKEQRVIVARVVYDGAPEAGKTTNLRQISAALSRNRRGELQTPGSLGSRTEYFDWLDFHGGLVNGYTLRCQIIGVPGQFALQTRRRHLLGVADAIVFVADSQEETLPGSSRSLNTLLEFIGQQRADGPAISMIVQANKQDLPNVLPPVQLAEKLGLAHDVPVLGASAATGQGVLQAFVLAVRLAAERVQVLLNGNSLEQNGGDAESAERLFAVLKSIDELPDRKSPGVPREVDPNAETIDSFAAQLAPPPAEYEKSTLRIPAASEVQAGMLWPPLKARSILAAINGAREIRRKKMLSPWAPEDSVELQSENRWTLHTSDSWVFSDQLTARTVLMNYVRKCLAGEDVLLEGRTLLVAQENGLWRLWMITPDSENLESVIKRALRSLHAPDLVDALRVVQEAINQILKGVRSSIPLPMDRLGCVALVDGRVRCLALPRPDQNPEEGWKAIAVERLLHELEQLFLIAAPKLATGLHVKDVVRRSGLRGPVLSLFLSTLEQVGEVAATAVKGG